MTNIGEIITIDVDPETNGGQDKAPAIVTAVYDDGSLRLRVFGSGLQDTDRNYVGDDGKPFPYPEDSATPAPAASTPTFDQVQAEIANLTPEQRQQLQAELGAAQPNPPQGDGQPNTSTL